MLHKSIPLTTCGLGLLMPTSGIRTVSKESIVCLVILQFGSRNVYSNDLQQLLTINNLLQLLTIENMYLLTYIEESTPGYNEECMKLQKVEISVKWVKCCESTLLFHD